MSALDPADLPTCPDCGDPATVEVVIARVPGRGPTYGPRCEPCAREDADEREWSVSQ